MIVLLSGFLRRALNARPISQRSILRHLGTMHRAPAAMLRRPPPADITINTPRDPNTLSNYNNFKTTHTRAVLDIDFEQKRVFGTVYLTLNSLTHGESKNLVLDTRCVIFLINAKFHIFLLLPVYPIPCTNGVLILSWTISLPK